MALTSAEVISKLDAAIISRASAIDPIGRGRRLFLEHVRDLIHRYGLPLPEEYSLDACAIPYVFQELNYYGYDCSKRTEDFGPLSDIVEIDVLTWSGGRDRSELTDDEFADYDRFCHRAIEYRTQR